jgi:serine/threonine protein kinase
VTIPAPEDRVGTTLAGKYVLERLLGVGGSGAVYEATHQRTGARHAIKLLLPSADRADAERMLREARALAKLEHEHIVRLVDLDEDSEGELYLVEELLRGRTLRALLDEELILSPQRSLELLVPVLRALGYAHARGIVHRDLKPENIFLCEDEAGRVTPKLLDFGLVREAATSGGTTRPGTLLGTPRYMSPEQAWGRDDIDGRSDLWSLGVVLYECLSGMSPFDGANDRAVLASIVTTDAPHLRSTGVAVDEDLADAVMLALTRAPEARVPSAAAWEEALTAAASLAVEPWHAALFPRRGPALTEPATSEPAPPAAPSRRPEREGRRAALALSMLALVVIVALSWAALRADPRDGSIDPTATQPIDARAPGPRPTESPSTASERPTGTPSPTTATSDTTTDRLAPDSTGSESRPATAMLEETMTTDSPTSVPVATGATGTLSSPAETSVSRAARRGGPRTGAGETRARESGADSMAPAVDSRPSAGSNAAPLVDEL